ncbi:hypothetical protein SADUNF_Sadunf04G0139700 [Salix dunnii]|uniref:EGF-like domain-containing protein n=1 Tax=Salix dunnii TaxID=1413687 RepID=A0A835KBR9_9ROSI|nr:hypothetical protein SADUNF_Sadunf04G0139700 [Salix dunnii]
MTLGSGPFMFSHTRNIFTAIGCDTLAGVTNYESTYGAACLSLCTEYVEMSDENPCSGSGCCKTSIPKGLKSLYYSLSTSYNYTNVSDFNHCGFAFLADNRSLKISNWPLSRTPKYGKDAYATDVVIEWVVENKTCEQAKANTSAYACGANAHCTYPEIDQGYRCSCKGYEGNPYLQEGCQGLKEKTPVKKVLARIRLEITSVGIHLANTMMVKQDVKELVSSILFQACICSSMNCCSFASFLVLLVAIGVKETTTFEKSYPTLLRSQGLILPVCEKMDNLSPSPTLAMHTATLAMHTATVVMHIVTPAIHTVTSVHGFNSDHAYINSQHAYSKSGHEHSDPSPGSAGMRRKNGWW